MEKQKPRLPLWLYYTMISSLASGTFVGVGYLLLVVFDVAKEIKELNSLIMIFLAQGPLIGFMVWLFFRSIGKITLLKFVGWIPGRVLGLLIGGLIGNAIAGSIGMGIGGVVFYLLGRWVGPQIGIVFATIMERWFDVIPNPDEVTAEKGKRFLVQVYLFGFPIIFIITVTLMNYFEIQTKDFLNWVLYLRILFILISISSALASWWIERSIQRQEIAFRTEPNFSPELTRQFIGMAFANIPLILGFILFFLGASIFEFYFYAGLSFLIIFMEIRRSGNSVKQAN